MQNESLVYLPGQVPLTGTLGQSNGDGLIGVPQQNLNEKSSWRQTTTKRRGTTTTTFHRTKIDKCSLANANPPWPLFAGTLTRSFKKRKELIN